MTVMKVISLIMGVCVINQALKNGDIKYSEVLNEAKTKKVDKTGLFLIEYTKNNEELLNSISLDLNSSKAFVLFPISHIYNMSLLEVGGKTWTKTQKEITENRPKLYNTYTVPK